MLEFLMTMAIVALIFCTATVFAALFTGVIFKIGRKFRKSKMQTI